MVGLAHIIIIPRVSPDREAEALRRVDNAVERLQRGESFAQVARDLSGDALTRSAGGKLGTFALDDLREDIARIASELKPGQVSDPVRTAYGIEIVRLDDRQGEQYTLSHILVRLQADHDDTVRAAQLAHQIQERAAAGESFESLAREYSQDAETRDNGGYVGEIELSALEAVHRAALASMEPGDISGVLTTSHGFQILKLVSRSAGRKPSLEEAKGWIRSVIETRKREELFSDWFEQARQEIYVERMEF